MTATPQRLPSKEPQLSTNSSERCNIKAIQGRKIDQWEEKKAHLEEFLAFKSLFRRARNLSQNLF